MSAVTTSGVQAPPRTRLAAIDGLRGIAIALVLLSHTWLLWDRPEGRGWEVMMTSGNYAVVFFFTIGGFLATRSLLGEVAERGQARPALFFVRRWIRISGHVYPLVLFVLVLTAIDQNMETYQVNDTRASAWHILTYTWNGYVREESMLARPDLGHLWYVCTDIWVVGMIALAVYLLRGRRVPLLALFLAGAVLVYLFRRHVFAAEGEAAALIRIHTRADALLLGAAAAVALPWVRRLRFIAREVGLVLVLALVPLAAAVNGEGFFTIWSVVLSVVLAALMLVLGSAETPLYIGRLLTGAPLVKLGEYSFALYVWHYPVFWYLMRNYPDLASWQKLVLGYGAAVLLALLAQRVIERPLVRWLGSSAWAPFSGGLVPGLRQVVADRVRRAPSSD